MIRLYSRLCGDMRSDVSSTLLEEYNTNICLVQETQLGALTPPRRTGRRYAPDWSCSPTLLHVHHRLTSSVVDCVTSQVADRRHRWWLDRIRCLTATGSSKSFQIRITNYPRSQSRSVLRPEAGTTFGPRCTPGRNPLQCHKGFIGSDCLP